MLGFRKTKTERERERLEGIEYQRRLQEEYKLASSGDVALHGGRDYVEPSFDRPCGLHPSFRVPHRRWLDVQPAPRFIDCPFCRDERVNGRRDLAREREATAEHEVVPVVVQLDRFEAAYAEHRTGHP